MSRSKKNIDLETGPVKSMALLFTALLFLAMGKAFTPEHSASSEQTTVAHQVHLQACKATEAATSLHYSPDTPLLISSSGHVGNNPSLLNNFPPLLLRPGQVGQAFVFTPAVKRCILFSCLRMEGPPARIL